MVQVHPVDLAWYVTRVEERARALSPALVAIARDHAAYVQGLTRQQTLLERRIYVIVPWSSALDAGTAATTAPLMRLLGRKRRSGATIDDQLFREQTISRQLTDRCDIVGRQLGRAGLRTTRLDDLGLAQLYHVGWAPEVARTQRLRRELSDYTALVVGPESRFGRQRTRRELSGLPNEEQRAARTPG